MHTLGAFCATCTHFSYMRCVQGFAGNLVLHKELPRSYSCVITKAGQYTMEDWLMFLETYSTLFLMA